MQSTLQREAMARVVLFLLLFFLALTSSAAGKEYFVAKTGSDTNPGSAALPWLTITKAASLLVAGDTVYIKAGTYKEQVVPVNSGSPGNYITYAAVAGETVTIDGDGLTLDDYSGLFSIIDKNYIRVTGLRIINAGPYDNVSGILVDGSGYITIDNNYTYKTRSSGIGVWDSHHVTVDSNEVELACNDGEQECITVATTSYFAVMNNTVHHNGPGTNGGEGIDAKDGSHDGTIHDNTVHHLNRLGIYIEAWDKHTYNIDVFNNTVHDISDADGFTLASEVGGLLENIHLYNNIAYNNDFNGLTFSNADSSPTPVPHPIEDCTVINNTFFNNGSDVWGGGIHNENPESKNIIIRNNIFSDNRHYQILLEVEGQNFTIDHNLIHGFRGSQEGETYGSEYVAEDPLFRNPAGADFHLQAGSPAVDSGSAQGAPADDFDGNIRPQGVGVDIGAYEFTLVVPVSVSPMTALPSIIMPLLLSE